MYRPPSKPPITRWAKRLDEIMRERGWSQTRLFEEIGSPLGLGPKSRSAILPLLHDNEPNDHQAAVLRDLFGDLPEVPPTAVHEPDPDLATALLALARSSQSMADELAALREERQTLVARVTDLEATVKALAARHVAGTGGGAAPHAPMQTAR